MGAAQSGGTASCSFGFPFAGQCCETKENQELILGMENAPEERSFITAEPAFMPAPNTLAMSGGAAVAGSKAVGSSSGLASRERAASPTKLVYIEREGRRLGNDEDGCSTRSGSAGRSTASGASKACTMAVLQVVAAVPPQKIDKNMLGKFSKRMQEAGLDLNRWGVRGAKSVEHLFWEVSCQRGSFIVGLDGGGAGLKRVTRLVKIRLTAEIFGVVHTLYSRMQFMHDGQTIERRQVPLRRLLWKEDAQERFAKTSSSGFDESVYEENCPHTEDWRDGCRKALRERLGLSEAWQKQNLVEEEDSYTYHTEDDVQSSGYPGLNTLYCIHGITYRVLHPEKPQVQCIGLPQGQEFATTEGEFNFNGSIEEDSLPIGTQLNIWTWERADPATNLRSDGMAGTASAVSDGSGKKKGKEKDKESEKAKEEKKKVEKSKSAEQEAQRRLIRRVPLPTTAATMVSGMQARMQQPYLAPLDSSSPSLVVAMKGLRTDWDKARKIAKRIMEPRYSLREFNQDLQAFPELNLYLLQEKTTSGNTLGDEYQRTIGAFYAIYWLMRLQVDGKEGFAFGVDSDWAAATTSDEAPRAKFHKSDIWTRFRKLFVDAGLIKEEWRMFGKTALVVNQKRLVALLALTAVHDIMKMSVLLPKVMEKDAPYHGFQAGDTIGDHDVALSYIMDTCPELLPSFCELDPEDKRSLHFTQCNLCFNYGWFVQAEAPPGATFSLFRQALIRDHKAQLTQQDVALYFVHWLTDLAGAEPTPLGGAEKFVLKFPLQVLDSFLRSFEFVQRITSMTETEVMEAYLKTRWEEYQPCLGEVPTGDAAVAKMRLVCQAQGNAAQMVEAFDSLNDDDREVLTSEMSRTGTLCQSYSSSIVPECVWTSPAGPAFTVYYGPAFLQRALEDGQTSAQERLAVLAELYRKARELWPINVAKAAQNVTIRIDMIKSMSITGMLEALTNHGDVWIMLKHNEHEAFVEICSRRKLNKLIATRVNMQILDLGSVHIV